MYPKLVDVDQKSVKVHALAKKNLLHAEDIVNNITTSNTDLVKALDSKEEIERFAKFFYSSDYFKFCFVRNPFSRILSCYLSKFKRYLGAENFVHYRKILEFKLDKTPSFIDFLRELTKPDRLNLDIHWMPQVKILNFKYGINNFDFIGRQENFDFDFDLVGNKLFFAYKNTENTTQLQTYDNAYHTISKIDEYYNQESIEIVRHLYRADFREFLYSEDIFL